ncbi:MAG: hypothetical protein ABIH70_00480 [Chloroflexota bacterium]
MNNNTKTGGILSIVSGGLGLLMTVWWLFAISMFKAIFNNPSFYGTSPDKLPPDFAAIMGIFLIFYAAMGLFYALIGILAIVGGVFALQKKRWGVALAGAIGATIVFLPTGIPAIIFVSLGKQEFSEPSRPAIVS